MPDDAISGDVLSDHFTDQEWLRSNLADISVEDSSDYYHGALHPRLPADDCGGMDIWEVREAMVALPDGIVRPTCACKHKCVERVMQAAAQVVRHLRDEVRDKRPLLEFVKQAHLATESPSARHKWKIAGHRVCSDAFSVLLGIGK